MASRTWRLFSLARNLQWNNYKSREVIWPSNWRSITIMNHFLKMMACRLISNHFNNNKTNKSSWNWSKFKKSGKVQRKNCRHSNTWTQLCRSIRRISHSMYLPRRLMIYPMRIENNSAAKFSTAKRASQILACQRWCPITIAICKAAKTLI